MTDSLNIVALISPEEGLSRAFTQTLKTETNCRFAEVDVREKRKARLDSISRDYGFQDFASVPDDRKPELESAATDKFGKWYWVFDTHREILALQDKNTFIFIHGCWRAEESEWLFMNKYTRFWLSYTKKQGEQHVLDFSDKDEETGRYMAKICHFEALVADKTEDTIKTCVRSFLESGEAAFAI